jgi:hypothetical protein
MQVHAAGETLLATTLLIITALALWTYTSRAHRGAALSVPGHCRGAGVRDLSDALHDRHRLHQLQLAQPAGRRRAPRPTCWKRAVPAAGSERAFSLHREARRCAACSRRRPTAGPHCAGHATLSAATHRTEPRCTKCRRPPATGRGRCARWCSSLPSLRTLTLRTPKAPADALTSCASLHAAQPLYRALPDGSLATSSTADATGPTTAPASTPAPTATACSRATASAWACATTPDLQRRASSASPSSASSSGPWSSRR